MFESPLSQQNPLNTSINPTFHNSELNLEPNRGIFSSSQTNSGFSQLKIENYNLTVSSSFSDRLLPLPTYDKLNSAVFLKQSLNKFVQLPNCGQLMQSIFGANFNIEKLNGIIYQWLVGDFSNLPKIEVREESVFPTNTLGAFAEATEKIYLSQRLLNSGNTVKIGNTILEEIGHWLDKQLNVADTPGDEGQMFAAVVTGQHLNADQIAEIRAEDDSTTIYVDGQLLKVEQSTLVLPTITISANDANASETLTGQIANPGQFTFTRTGSTTSALTVNYAVGGTATNGVDYSTLTNSVTFTAGASTAIININPIDDSVFEGNETVVLALANNTNYVIGAANNTTVVIADNDQPNITVINPNGGNSLQAGNSYNITWNDNISENVKIDLYKAGNLYSTLFSSTTSDGGETWTLPSNLASGSDYKIKITSVNNGNLFDFSDANFTINSVPFDYAGNSLIQARNIGTLSSKQYFSDFVGDADTNDYYKFSVSSPSNFNLSLSGLSGNADVQLIQDINGNSQIDANEILGSSILTGSSAESISVPLFSGNYYVRIYPSGNGINTNYNLNLSATSLGNYNYTDPSPTNNTYYNTPVTRSFFNSNEIGVYQSQYATSLMYGSIADYYTNNQYANQNTTNGLFGVYSGLGLPTSPIYKKDDGSFVMDFEGGTLTNRNGIVTPFYNQKASSFALVGQGAPDGTELQWKNDYSYWSKNVGTPTTAVRYVAGGWVQEFADSQGNIINIFSVKNGQQLTQGGPYRVQGAMLDIYRLTGGYERQNGGLGFATQITEQSNVNGYKHYQTFENGFIGVTADNKITIKNWQGQLINVVGYDGVAINSTYRNTFNRDGGTASLGSPINNVHSWGNGYIQDFTGGSDGKGGIMKSNANDNSYWVGGDFWNKFVEAGGAGGILYYPTSDRYSTVNGALRQDFQGGAIIKSDKGIFTVYGGIGSQYLKVEGGEKGRLGLPTSGEVGIGNGVVVQNFEKGRIVWNNGSTRTEMYGQTPSQPPQTGGSSFSYGGNTYQWTSYTIRDGDSLSAIAQRTLGDANGYSFIAQRNGISNPNKINAGQVIDVPQLFNASNPPVPTPSQPPQTGGSSFSYGGNTYQWTSYTIRDGDSLSAIAQRTLGDANGYNFIAQRNGISNPNKINAGQVIEVPLLLNGSNPPVQTPSQPPQTGGSSFNYGGKAYQWTSYTIKSGDSLSAIAQRTLGDANGYSVIAQRNGISNPNNVYGGQVIDIPVLFNNSNSPFVPPQQPAQTGSVFDIAVNNAINRIGGLGVVGKLIISPTHVSTNDGSGWFEEFQAANGEQRLLALQDGKSTAYWVHGDNLREYLKWGGAYGALGLPTNEETQFTASQTGTKGIWQGFSGSGGKARIYNHPTLGSVATWGSIGSFYEDMGAANSWLGLPTKAEQQAADGVTIWAEFERGKIVFNQQTGKSEALRTGQPPSWISIKGTDSQSISGITIDPGSVTKKVEGLIGTYAFIIDRLNYKDLSNGSRVLSFDVFNTGYAQGVIEVRNAQGQLVEIRGIEGIRNPTSVFGFGIESIQRLWRLATEGYGFTDPRNSLGSSEKTEIRNVVIPPGGSLKITKTGTYAAAYNLAKIGMDLLFEFGLPKVFEENYSLKMKLWSAIYAEVLQENVKSLAADGEFNLNTSEDARKSLEASNWLNKQELAKLTEISIKVLAEELPTFKFYSQYSLLAPAQQIVDNLEKLNSWITLAETFAKGSNTFLQSLDLERAKKLEPTTQLIKFITK